MKSLTVRSIFHQKHTYFYRHCTKNCQKQTWVVFLLFLQLKHGLFLLLCWLNVHCRKYPRASDDCRNRSMQRLFALLCNELRMLNFQVVIEWDSFIWFILLLNYVSSNLYEKSCLPQSLKWQQVASIGILFIQPFF